MQLLINTVRVSGFRGLKNIEINLDQTTVLTGMNNSGKTSFLKALQIAMGSRQFITSDDFHFSKGEAIDRIIIDIRIIPVNDKGEQVQLFEPYWETLFTEQRISVDSQGNSFIAYRTKVTFDQVKSSYKFKYYQIQEWVPYKNKEGISWEQIQAGKEIHFFFEEMPFFFVDAQRDILDDMKNRSSYLGKMLSKIKYSEEDIQKIEDEIQKLNEHAVEKSEILSSIKSTLKELDVTMGSDVGGVEITPFTKKIRDLNKGLSIYYSNNKESFPMEYHGMGTRSWSSLLILKSFILAQANKAHEQGQSFFPILAIEEPEAHLHPNAQKTLFTQIKSIYGQKIISTHSPYIAAASNLESIRSIYNKEDQVYCGQVNTSLFEAEDIRKINIKVTKSRGEIFFSKAIVFFEGETEEQMLPILAEHFFGKSTIDLGLDFVSVDGHGNYLPFLRVADSLNIPWFIFSDGEPRVIKSVEKTIKALYNHDITNDDMKNVFIIQNEGDIEKHLIDEGFIDEIKSAFNKLHYIDYLENEIREKDGKYKATINTEDKCGTCDRPIQKKIFKNYSGDEGYIQGVLDCMRNEKTQFGAHIPYEIIASNKPFPSKIAELFEAIKKTLYK